MDWKLQPGHHQVKCPPEAVDVNAEAVSVELRMPLQSHRRVGCIAGFSPRCLDTCMRKRINGLRIYKKEWIQLGVEFKLGEKGCEAMR